MMQFPFTFNLNIPGLHNPFLVKSGPVLSHSRIEGSTISRQMPSLPPPRFPPTNSLSPPLPLARKRGWIPSEPEPSHAATSATSTIGYLDTPAKYRGMPLREPEEEAVEMIAGVSSSPSCAHIPLSVTSLVYVIPLHIPRARRHHFLKEKRTTFSPSYSPVIRSCCSLATCSSSSM